MFLIHVLSKSHAQLEVTDAVVPDPCYLELVEVWIVRLKVL